MRPVPIALLLSATAACATAPIETLTLAWRGVSDTPRPSAAVAEAFAAAPISFGLRDVRPDPAVVGGYEDSSLVLRTSDNVAQYCSTRIGEMLTRAGARLTEPASAMLETELVEYRVVEGGAFNGMVTLRANLRSGQRAWSKIYTGKSLRWGRSHSPDNFNEALSNALADATSKLVQDDEFARALGAGPPRGAAHPARG